MWMTLRNHRRDAGHLKQHITLETSLICFLISSTLGAETYEQALRSEIEERAARLDELVMKEQQLTAKSKQL
ncbi:hypothetical protein LLEC1_06520 [Akanthomyces lecanii]|uniref:Uncharacterized protein n=1 Tax=Cordyceps confragosa TaxID=2714763 RepID=A0A179IM96_CORDF|nr:hypothetical protein LLEC1_06520 [Akanthomyces lecanii]